MKKHAWLLMVPVFLAGVYTSSVDASWLSKQLDKLDKISQSTITTDSNGTMTYPAQTKNTQSKLEGVGIMLIRHSPMPLFHLLRFNTLYFL